jgi:hypothetical protein
VGWTYLEDGVEDTSDGSRKDVVRIRNCKVLEPQETVMSHARNGQFTHSSQTSESTDTNPSLYNHETSHGEDSTHVRPHDLCLLHLVTLLCRLVTTCNRVLHLLLNWCGQRLESCQSCHPVRTECLEEERSATHCYTSYHDRACPAPSRVQVDLLNCPLEYSCHTPAIVQTELLQLSSMVDEFSRVDLGFHFPSCKQVIHGLGVVEGGSIVGDGACEVRGAVYYGSLINARGREFRSIRCDIRCDVRCGSGFEGGLGVV